MRNAVRTLFRNHRTPTFILARLRGRTQEGVRHPPFWSGLAFRRSTAALALRTHASKGLSVGPGFAEFGACKRRVTPAGAVPLAASTSHAGHNAGRLMSEPPGNGLQIRPRAPSSPDDPACLRATSFKLGEDCYVALVAPNVNSYVTEK